jgi:hypothetical protein
MVTHYLRMVEEGRSSQALHEWAEIEKLQFPPWAEKYWQDKIRAKKDSLTPAG